jgi:hypothetical protein
MKNMARLTGILYLMITVLAPFSMIYIPSHLIVSGDAAATAHNIMAPRRCSVPVLPTMPLSSYWRSRLPGWR